MPQSYGFSQVTVDDPSGVLPDGLPEKMSATIRNGTITLRPVRDQTVLAELSGVAKVTTTGRRVWTVELDTGEMLTLTKPKNCGCGS